MVQQQLTSGLQNGTNESGHGVGVEGNPSREESSVFNGGCYTSLIGSKLIFFWGTNLSICIYTYIHIYVCIYCMDIMIYVYVCIYISVQMYRKIYIYIYTTHFKKMYSVAPESSALSQKM